MKKKGKQGVTVLDIFRKNQDAVYPQLLVKYLDSDELKFQLEKAEYLLNMWTDQYIKMPQISKSTYYNVILKILKLLFSVYLHKKRGAQSVAKLYYLFYKKWPQVTQNVKKGLAQSNKDSLLLFWSISFNMIRAINLVERQQFGSFLSEHFQKSLSMYKWKCHSEKVYILQIIKYINNQNQYQSFIQNGKKWQEIIKQMKNEPFKSQIGLNKSQLHLEVFKYQYDQIKIARQNQPQSKKFEFKNNKKQDKNKPKNVGEQQNMRFTKEKLAQFEKQYLSREQINMFLIVKHQQQQKQIYRIQLLGQIISCRPLMCIICEDYWQSLTYQVISQISQKLQKMNADIKTDMLLAKMFLSILKYRRTSRIIRQKIGQQIVVNIIKNIQLLDKRSPFETPELSQLPTLVNKAFFYITPEMEALKITVQSIVNKRVKSIIDQANVGKDDIVNRSLMTVSCRQQLTLKLPILKQVKHFLMSVKKKKNLAIQTCIVLVKILLSSRRSPDFKQLNAFLLAQTLTYISQNFISNPKVNQLRKLNIQLLKTLIPPIADNQQIVEGEYGPLIINILQWLEVVQLNFKIVYAPMIHILIMLMKRYRQYFLTEQSTMEYVQKILTGLMEKLGHQHNSENMFAFLNCLLIAYVKLQWTIAAVIYQQIPSQSFVGWQIIYRKQMICLFKKQYEVKWNDQMQKQKEKQQRQQKFASLLKRRQSIGGVRKLSSSFDQSTDFSNNSIMYVDMVQQKKCQQKMNIYFGKIEKGWIKQMINNFDLWNNESLIKSEFACLEYSLIQTVNMVERDYYIKAQRPNQFIKQLVASLDEDMQKLFAYLMNSQSYQLLFLFASKIFFLCRDYFFVKKLKSYQLLINKCFEILSVFFNKIQILYACSTYSSLLLPYANHPQLKIVYDQLNYQQYITDLFKGSNQFIGKQKCYYPWLVKILMAYQITEPFRTKLPLVRQSLQTLGKNLLWWGNVDYLINPQIDVDDPDVEQSRILIFDIFKEQYKKLMSQYFTRVQGTIQNAAMQKKLGVK